MVKTALVERDIEDGKKLLEYLDKTEFRAKAAFWFYLSDSDSWRLILASPIVDDEGPREAYKRVQLVLKKITPPLGFTLSDLSVVSPKDDMVKLLRIAIQTTGPGISGIRFTRNAINNIMIEDAYIYRM